MKDLAITNGFEKAGLLILLTINDLRAPKFNILLFISICTWSNDWYNIDEGEIGIGWQQE